jgi:hypothetical protein
VSPENSLKAVCLNFQLGDWGVIFKYYERFLIFNSVILHDGYFRCGEYLGAKKIFCRAKLFCAVAPLRGGRGGVF